MTVQQLLGIHTDFFNRLQSVYKKERCQLFKEYLKIATKQGNDIYYLREGNGFFRVSRKSDGTYILTDEIEKIELVLDETSINEVHNLLKGEKKVQKIMKDNVRIKETLEQEYKNGNYRTFNDKPYLVYDIETIWTTNDLKDHSLSVGYMLDSTTGNYKLITAENAAKFVEYMLEFDGYIVGFYNIGFDNPVMLYNTTFTQEHLDILNHKSIDIFFFVQNLLKKRMGLNKLVEALVGVKKTLESGVEGANMYKQYLETGEKKLLEAVKKYCKNDVTMTHLLFLYLLKYQQLYDDGEEITFVDDDIIALAHNRGGGDTTTMTQDSMFQFS